MWHEGEGDYENVPSLSNAAKSPTELYVVVERLEKLRRMLQDTSLLLDQTRERVLGEVEGEEPESADEPNPDSSLAKLNSSLEACYRISKKIDYSAKSLARL